MAAVVCLDNNDQYIDTLYLLNKKSYRNLEVKPTLKDSLYTLPPGTQKLCYIIEGKDQLSWRGQYGPRFRAMDMRLFQSSDIPTNFTATVDPALGDSITLSKTSNIAFGEAITVSATYPDFPIRRIITTPVQFVEDATIICRNDIVVSAQFYYMHNVLTDNTYATITATPSRAKEGDTIRLNHTMKGGCYLFQLHHRCGGQLVGRAPFYNARHGYHYRCTTFGSQERAVLRRFRGGT